MEFAAIDFETANEQITSACALGITVVKNGRVTDRKSWLIRPPELLFRPYNTLIHGLTEEDVQGEPEFSELWPVFREYLQGRIAVAHSAEFDFAVLRRLFDHYNISYPELRFSCSRVIAKRTWPGMLSYRLNMVAGFLGFEFKHHDAGEDAFASAEIVRHACRHIGAESLEDLSERLEIIHGELSPGVYRPMRKRQKRSHENDLDPMHPFFNRMFVFTGSLQSMTREEAKQVVVDAGGFCSSTVNEYTNYVILGSFDARILKNGGKTSKLKKTETLCAEGADIEVIGEDEFLEMLKTEKSEAPLPDLFQQTASS